MLKVLDVFKVGKMLSVTIEGNCEKIANGSKLIDNSGRTIVVNSVAMVHPANPADTRNNTTVLIDNCDIEVGSELSIA